MQFIKVILLCAFLIVLPRVHAADCSHLLVSESRVEAWVRKNTTGSELLSSGQMATVVTVMRPFFDRILRHESFHPVYAQVYQDANFASRYPITSPNPLKLDITFFPDDQLLTDCEAYAHLKNVRVCDIIKAAAHDTRLISEAPAESSRGLLYVPPKYISEMQGITYDYFAHEFAHLLHFNFMTVAEIKELERLYVLAIESDLALDDYAAQNETEYFAQGLEAYFARELKQKINYIYWDHTRSELMSKDPALYNFIEKLMFWNGRVD